MVCTISKGAVIDTVGNDALNHFSGVKLSRGTMEICTRKL